MFLVSFFESVFTGSLQSTAVMGDDPPPKQINQENSHEETSCRCGRYRPDQ
jgi:hypothetical protein